MRSRFPYAALGGVVLAVALADSSAWAAFAEWEIINEVNGNVAVLRYLHREVREMREKLDVVRNARELTIKQAQAQAQILADEKAKAKPSKVKIEVYQIDLDRLKRQQQRLQEFSLEKAYGQRLAELNKSIDRFRIQIDARIFEYRVHFGREPRVTLDFESKVSRFRQKRLGLSYLTIR